MVYSRLLIGLTVGVVLIGAVDARAQTENQDIAELQVGNKTYALIVESVAELSTIQAGKNKIRRLKIIVKNGCTQPVVAYAFDQKDNNVGEGNKAGRR